MNFFCLFLAPFLVTLETVVHQNHRRSTVTEKLKLTYLPLTIIKIPTINYKNQRDFSVKITDVDRIFLCLLHYILKHVKYIGIHILNGYLHLPQDEGIVPWSFLA